MSNTDEKHSKPVGVKKSLTLTVRLSPLTYVIWGGAVLVLVILVIALSLPWGVSKSTGEDVSFTVYGLLPWFLLVPVFMEMAFVLVPSRLLRAFYVLAILIISALVILMQCIAGVTYETAFRPGFYLMYAAAGLCFLLGVLCLAEGAVYPRLVKQGKARLASFGQITRRGKG